MAEDFDISEDLNLEEILTDQQLEEKLTKTYYFKAMKDTCEIYFYNKEKGIYENAGDWLIEQECMKQDPSMKTNNVTDIKNHITWSNFVNRNEFDPEIERLCFKNCMVN